MTSSFSIWGCVLKGCFERYILKGQIVFEGHMKTSILNTECNHNQVPY